MAEWMKVMNQFDRMCLYYQRKHECSMGCPMNGVNISQCRKIAFECPDSVERTIMSWAAEHPEPVYPTWGDWLAEIGLISWQNNGDGVYSVMVPTFKMCKPIPADIAQKLGVESKEAR